MSIRVKSGGSYANVQNVFVKQGGTYQAASVFAKVAGQYQAVGGGSPPVAVYDPVSLFALGEVGILYDPQRIETLWQDTAGTIPVTADGQLVARIDDRSGNGFHITQANPANQMKYRDDGNLKWLDTEGRQCIYASTYRPTGPLTYAYSIEVTRSTGTANIWDTGASSSSDVNSIFLNVSGSADTANMTERGGSIQQIRSITDFQGRHAAIVARLPFSGDTTYIDFGRAAVLPRPAVLQTNQVSGSGFRYGSVTAKQVRNYGFCIIQRVITEEEANQIGAYYASIGKQFNQFIWVGHVS